MIFMFTYGRLRLLPKLPDGTHPDRLPNIDSNTWMDNATMSWGDDRLIVVNDERVMEYKVGHALGSDNVLVRSDEVRRASDGSVIEIPW